MGSGSGFEGSGSGFEGVHVSRGLHRMHGAIHRICQRLAIRTFARMPARSAGIKHQVREFTWQPALQLTILASLQRVFVRRRSWHPSAEAARSQELGNRCARAMPPHSVTSRTLLDGRWARMERRAIPVPFSFHEPSAARRERRARTRLRHGTAVDFGGKVRAESGRDGPHCVMLA